MNYHQRPTDVQIEKFLDEAYGDNGKGVYGIYSIKTERTTGRRILIRVGRAKTHYGATQFQLDRYYKYGPTVVAYFSGYEYGVDELPTRLSQTDTRILY
jgi:hypothetical protein